MPWPPPLAEVASATGPPSTANAPRRSARSSGSPCIRRAADAQLAGRPGEAPGRGGRLRVARRGLPPALWRGASRGASAHSPRSASRSISSGTDQFGGFFTTGSDAEALVVRPKEFLDGALPATNSIALTALRGANALVDDPWFDQAADRTSLARPLLTRHPAALADLVAALPTGNGRYEIVVTGEWPDLLAEVRRRWLPAA